jgi:hypothetical protein
MSDLSPIEPGEEQPEDADIQTPDKPLEGTPYERSRRLVAGEISDEEFAEIIDAELHELLESY